MKETLDAIDAAWLGMDRPTNALVIHAALVLGHRVDLETVVQLVEDRLLYGHPRFKQCVVREHAWSQPAWQDDPSFDVLAHVHHVALPAPAGEPELAALIGDLASQSLDHSRPLWQLYLVDGPGDRSTLVLRIHHCIGDGVALVRVLLSLTDDHDGDATAPHVGLAAPHPHGIRELATSAAAQAATLGRLVLLPADAPSALKGPLGVVKRIAFAPPVPLADLRAIARADGATTNDVVLSAVTGALRAHLTRLEDGSDPLEEIRAVIPVFVHRTSTEGVELGNGFGLVFVPLPLFVADPHARLREIHRRTSAMKSSPEAVVALGVLVALGVAATELEQIGVGLFSKKGSVMVTNVPGPRISVRLAGATIERLLVWAPVAGEIALSFSVISYAGALTLGVASDAQVLPDPEHLVASFVAELDSMRRAGDAKS